MDVATSTHSSKSSILSTPFQIHRRKPRDPCWGWRELAEEVRQFWLDTYSANLMALAVIPQDLNTLEAWIVDRFSAVPNHQHHP